MLTVGAVIVLRLIAGWVQFGPLFSPKAAAPKFSVLNPLTKFKEMFSAKAFLQILISLLKAITLAAIFWFCVHPRLPQLVAMAGGSLDAFWRSAAELLKTLAHTVMGVLLVFAITDFAIQKYFYLKQNRMSHEDIKNEHKQMEGDPHAKGHRKQVAHEILNGPVTQVTAEQMAEADVLMINPTHFAVGLFYRPDETPLPRVLFKAQDEDVKALIALAHDAKIPVVRYIWLTRTLHRTTAAGAYIPRDTIKSVAAIYRLLRKLEAHSYDRPIEFDDE